jgi:hypothetical protein
VREQRGGDDVILPYRTRDDFGFWRFARTSKVTERIEISIDLSLNDDEESTNTDQLDC